MEFVIHIHILKEQNSENKTSITGSYKYFIIIIKVEH